MARIETYPLDGNISVNDYVIGTDGDNLNATKNYKMLTMLDYLGTQYNLNSADLLFVYNNVASTSVGDGQVSTNNYADGTILMSGVTNIYVSKLTTFGVLVDDILTLLGTDGLSIMFTDMGNRNNTGLFTVVSAADVDANTINLTVTGTSTNGSITTGLVFGLRIGIGGGGGGSISDTVYGAGWNADTTTGASKNALYDKIETLVTLATAQTITALKSFYTGNVADPVAAFIGHIRFGGTIPTYNDSSAGFGYDTTSDTWFFQEQNGVLNFGLLDFKSISANRTYTFQDADGTIAFLSDLTGGYVDLTSVQSVGGIKSFTDLLTVKNSMWINGGSNKITFANSSESSASSTSGLTVYSKAGSLGWALPDTPPSNRRGIFTNANTAERTYTFQDADGTVAHLTDIPTVSDTAYNATSWNANTDAATKNAIRDQFESLPAYTTSTFTPTLVDSTGGVVYTTSSANGRYVKIGAMVHIEMSITVTADDSGTPSGNLWMGSLPFAVANNYAIFNVEVSGAGIAITSYYSIHAALATSQTTDLWFKMQTGLDSQNDTILTAPAHTGGNTTIKITGTYYTTA